MKILVLGANGQLGRALRQTLPAALDVTWAAREQADLSQPVALRALLARAPADVIVNAGAYTAVDRAEQEPALAHAINADAVATLAQHCAAHATRLIHVSTDFVFAGRAAPYEPAAECAPLNVYGASKRAGEIAILQSGADALIVRTAWVYSRFGNNFAKTMLRLMRERDVVSVVADQIGTPTSATGLAQMLWQCVAQPALNGLQHWTDAGVASWYDFAVAIYEEARAAGLLERDVDVRPIRTDQYPTPARRPACCVLDKSATWAALNLTPPHWRAALRAMLADLNTLGET